jgi:hypothetical protein
MGAASGDTTIIVALKDLTTAGFSKIDKSLTGIETKANGVNLSGFSGKAKTLETDAEKAAEGSNGKGGLASMISGLSGLAGPAGIAVVALAALIPVGIALYDTYEKVKQQTDLLDTALKNNGDSLANEQTALDNMIAANENYGQNADDTRAAVTELAQAGQSWTQITAAMPAILDLAAAKHIDLGTAAKEVELAEMGNAKALKDLGIAIPKVTAAQSDLTAADKAVTADQKALADAMAAQNVIADANAAKKKVSAADSEKLRVAQQKVTNATAALTAAQAQQKTAQDAVNSSLGKGTVVVDAIEGKLKGSKSSATSMAVATAKLNDDWEKVATEAGPGITAAMDDLATAASRLVDDFAGVWGWLEKVGVINDVASAFRAWVGIEEAGFGVIQTLINLLAQLWQKIEDVGKAIQNSPIGALGGAVNKALGAVGSVIPHFAAGGDYGPGVRLVGEHGPELDVSGHSGTIIPNGALGSLGGGSQHLHVHVHSYVTPTRQQIRQLASDLEGEMGRVFGNNVSTSSAGGGY